MVGHMWSINLSVLHRGLYELVWHLSRVLCNTPTGAELPVNHCMAWSHIGVLPVLNLCHLGCDARYVWA